MTEVSPVELSLEFFPARDSAGHERLLRNAQQLASLEPKYVSVTFGAGGSTREGTLATLEQLIALGFDVAPHLSCIGATPESLRELLQTYRDLGVRRLVALRGDLPSGMGPGLGELRYASDLVKFIRDETGDWFHIEVAAYPEMHPQAPSPQKDLTHFVTKMQAGADSAITQYFYNADSYFDFVERVRAAGISAPIVPGIMPITNHTQLLRFSDASGTEVPRWVRLRLASFGDDRTAIREFGVEVVSELCQRLIDGGAPGLHFYTLNQAESVMQIWQRLQHR